MSPGEIHGLHKKIVDDLRAEVEQQRTRAEAAEQETREQHAAYIAPMSDKLAAIRAHLAGVDLSNLSTVPLRVLVAAAREALEP
jgi:hypothetical protein